MYPKAARFWGCSGWCIARTGHFMKSMMDLTYYGRPQGRTGTELCDKLNQVTHKTHCCSDPQDAAGAGFLVRPEDLEALALEGENCIRSRC